MKRVVVAVWCGELLRSMSMFSQKMGIKSGFKILKCNHHACDTGTEEL